MVDLFPHPTSLVPGLWFLGGLSWSSNQTRIITTDGYREIGGEVTTPSEIARAYLDVKFPKPLRVDKRTYAANHLDAAPRVPPLYAAGGWEGEAVYLDMKAAYWQILQAVGWSVEYIPNVTLGIKSDVSDFPYPDDKLARNILVSTGLRSSVATWDGKNIKRKPLKNRHANGVLWSLVQDVLHGVALDMVQWAGAVYVATDGYIVPIANMNIAHAIADEWRIHLVDKQIGQARIYGATDYEIAQKLRAKNGRTYSYDNLGTLAEVSWLRKKFAWATGLRAALKVKLG